MEELKPDEARGGTTSRNHKVLKVLVVSLLLAFCIWFVLELVY